MLSSCGVTEGGNVRIKGKGKVENVDNSDHLQRDYEDFQEALGRNAVYFVGIRVYSMETSAP